MANSRYKYNKSLLQFKFFLNFVDLLANNHSTNCNFRFKEEDENQLQREYEMMLQGLRQASEQNDADMFLANPILPEDVLKGN